MGLEVCISLIFKPFLHHLKVFLKDGDDKLITIWKSVLKAMVLLLGGTSKASGSQSKLSNMDVEESLDRSNSTITSMSELLITTKELASEHLRNAVMVLVASSILKSPSDNSNDGTDNESNITSYTWKCIANMDFCKDHVKEWERSAALMSSGISNVSVTSRDGSALAIDVLQNIDTKSESTLIA